VWANGVCLGRATTSLPRVALVVSSFPGKTHMSPEGKDHIQHGCPTRLRRACPALSVVSCLIAFLAELYRQTLAVPGCHSI
jgi:hypothetical protein